MRQVMYKLIDFSATTFCSYGPLKSVGTRWWRMRLDAVHNNLPMESYLSRSQTMQTFGS